MDGIHLALLTVLLFVGMIPVTTIHVAYGHEIVCITEPCEHTHDDRFGTPKPINPPAIVKDPVVVETSRDLTIVERVQQVFQDIRETLTFDPLEKAKLKLQDAENNQSIINQSVDSGESVPVQLEERRVNKLNEALDIVTTNADSISNSAQLIEDIRFLQRTGELNEIKLLYSQIDEVKNADQTTKDEYNKRVNNLETWNQYCFKEFDIDEYLPLGSDQSMKNIKETCPRIAELDEQFDLEAMYNQHKDEI